MLLANASSPMSRSRSLTRFGGAFERQPGRNFRASESCSRGDERKTSDGFGTRRGIALDFGGGRPGAAAVVSPSILVGAGGGEEGDAPPPLLAIAAALLDGGMLRPTRVLLLLMLVVIVVVVIVVGPGSPGPELGKIGLEFDPKFEVGLEFNGFEAADADAAARDCSKASMVALSVEGAGGAFEDAIMGALAFDDAFMTVRVKLGMLASLLPLLLLLLLLLLLSRGTEVLARPIQTQSSVPLQLLRHRR